MIFKKTFLLFIFCSLLVALFSGCKSKKNITQTAKIESKTARTETKIDTFRIIVSSQSNLEETISVHETATRETIHLDDSSGRVRSIVRESISKNTGERRHDRGSGCAVSMAGKSDFVSQKETQHAKINEKTDITVDSRPVQGAEWIWVILLSCALIAAVVIYILYNKLKTDN